MSNREKVFMILHIPLSNEKILHICSALYYRYVCIDLLEKMSTVNNHKYAKYFVNYKKNKRFLTDTNIILPRSLSPSI